MKEYEALMEGYRQGITEKLGENPVLMPFHLQTIPHTGLAVTGIC